MQPGQQALHAFPMASFVTPELEALPDGFWGWGHGKTVRSGATRADTLRQLQRLSSLQLEVSPSGSSGGEAAASFECAPAGTSGQDSACVGGEAGAGDSAAGPEMVCGVEKASWEMLEVQDRLDLAEVLLPYVVSLQSSRRRIAS